MKYLFIAGDISRIGGIEKYNRDFYAALKNTSESTVLVERREGGILAKFFFVIRIIWQYITFRPDYVFCGHLNFAPVCLFLKCLFGVPYTLALYGIEIITLHSELMRSAVKNASKIITISEYSKSLILKQYPSLYDHIFMLPSAVDGSIFTIKKKNQALLDKLGIDGRPIILSLARLSTPEHKGQDRVLASLPLILKKIPNAVYLIVGGGTDERVNTTLRESPWLKNYVIFAGPVSNEERVDYYNLGDVYVLPSKYEGFGIVFIESLACGVPVIASDGYGCREGLLNGELGIVVPPDDLQAIANAIELTLDRKAPNSMLDKEYLRRKTLEIYGIETWNKRVENLINLLST